MKKNKLKYFTGLLALVLGIVLVTSCQPEYEPEIYTYPEFSITDFTPKAGLLGEPLTITGANFGDHVEAATISFNGVVVDEEDVVSYSDTEIVVNIPQEAVTGPIEIKIWTQNITTETFTVLPTPTIASIVSQGMEGEDVAAPGETVLITGENFYTDPGRVTIEFNGKPAEITSLESNSIEVIAPQGYTTGRVVASFDDYTLEGPFIAPTVETRIREVLFLTRSLTSHDIAVAEIINDYKDGNFFNVTILPKSVIEESDLGQLNKADVVIMGRNVPSNSYGGDTRAVWDNIERPVLSMNMYGLRNYPDRANWLNTTSISSGVDATLSAEILVDDPVFGDLSGTIDWWHGNYNIFPDDPSLAGNGILLAKSPAGSPLFIRWDANIEFYDGAGHSPKGIRTFFGCGSDGGGVIHYFEFSEPVKEVFFKELDRMARHD
ncbi:IPT/TIG domain-containing protein [Echinicola jeungdonensis]|uniref:IPT/TIG domain-containing protein n=1 Tax=Echinicola jeungdonensis TaxID=709343 RepID=A0ABV5JAG1_9BACT|nr:IPT/TIG domain-containing protein [Echinicola jeungdonensis]MDN3670441.1 IPT/TIG domain-containing protein [Echinicola jeungdonensis]